MTAQQLLLGNGATALGPQYIGWNTNKNTDSSRITVRTPSTTQIGDLVLLFAAGANSASTELSWSCVNTNITEVRDTGTAPNLYFGYGYATAAGASLYTLNLTRTPNTRAFVVVYRNAVYDKNQFIESVSTTPVNLLIAPTNYPANIIGFGSALRGNTTWTVSNGATILLKSESFYPVSVGFKKDNVVDYQSFSITGMSTNIFQGLLVSITTSAYTPPIEGADYWSDWPTQMYGWQEGIFNEWWAS